MHSRAGRPCAGTTRSFWPAAVLPSPGLASSKAFLLGLALPALLQLGWMGLQCVMSGVSHHLVEALSGAVVAVLTLACGHRQR